MGTISALMLARAYHGAWTGGRIEEAGEYLADDLSVEVPINAYPTKVSFVEAVGFTQNMASDVKVLSEFGSDDEALILYDMSLPFGVMRVAEHFTVSRGKINRIRQIHDTHALRAAAAAAPGPE
jgi:hypothetical protein